jgi:hypothetical protein
VPAVYDYAWSFEHGLATVRSNNVFLCIDRTGAIKHSFTNRLMGPLCEGYAAFYSGDRFGFVVSSDRVVVAPQYDAVGSFSFGLAPVRVGDKWGYINKTNAFVVPPTYRQAWEHDDTGFALVYREWTRCLLDINGKVVISDDYRRPAEAQSTEPVAK